MKTLKLNKKTEREIEQAVDKIIKEYGCVLLALSWDNKNFIKECEDTGHKKYHKLKGRMEVDN